MPDKLRVRQLIEKMLESGSSAEEVCRASPELLPQVREGWRNFRAIRAQVGVLFPRTDSFMNRGHESPSDLAADLPQFPGYEVQELLGQGGMGAVFRARQLRLNRLIALKMMLAGAYAGRDQRGRFQREAEAVAGLQHPNIVQIHDVGESAGRPYFTMEFLGGGSLAQQMAGIPQPSRRAAELLATLAGAVQFAHQGGIVHRDLKPSNVLLAADGTPKISDFGLARRLDGGAGLTRSGLVVGTPSYMAPEQARGDTAALGPGVDVYALGAILYELLTGRPPFRAETAAETVRQVIDQDPAPPSSLNTKVPRDLETICLKCLHKEPMFRYTGAEALAADLRRFLRGEAIAARPEGRMAKLVRKVRRRPALSAAVAVGSLLTATLTGGGLWLIVERAETARTAEAQRVATERAVEEDLRELVRWEEASSWPAAAAALERAKVRLDKTGSAELCSRLQQGARDLELVARLDAIRLNRAATVVGSVAFVDKQADDEFEAAFRGAGLGRLDEAPAPVASRVRASKIRGALLAALDDWAMCSGPGRHDWLMEVARQADRGSPAWRDLARDPATWENKATLRKVIADAPVDEQSVSLLLTLDLRLRAGAESVPFLKRIQQAHPDDFWVNLRLGNVLLHNNKYGEAIGYYQAALAIRPETGVVFNKLDMSPSDVGRQVEALPPLVQAAKREGASVVVKYNLANALSAAGRPVEAIDQLRLALRLNPKSAMLHLALGHSLDDAGQQGEAEAEKRQAITLDPKLSPLRTGIRRLLTHEGRLEEARLDWEKDIALDPPDHDDWDGYAELCLFLGHEAEYRRASRALIRRFEHTSEAPIAERTGRACLLSPVPEAEALQAARLIDQALASQDNNSPTWSYPYYLFARALAEYRLDRMESSIAILQGEASRVLGPSPQLVMAMAQHRLGREDEARKTLAGAVLSFDWRASRATNREVWVYHVLRREAERTILPDLDSFLGGTHRPRDNDERFALMGACQFAGRPQIVAGLYADAFAQDPQLAEDFRHGHRYRAACVAALAGRGVGGAPGEAERSRWRRQARQWLRADLSAWNAALDGEPTKTRDQVRRALKNWKGEPDLFDLRDPAELEKLPPDERADCLALWDAARTLLDRVEQVE